MTQKISEIETQFTDHDHSNEYITKQKFKWLTAENFAARLAQVKLATKADIADFIKKTDFDVNLKSSNKKVCSNETKQIEAEKKITDLTNKVAQISGKGYAFLLGRINFTGNDGYQNFLFFFPMLSSLILDRNKKLLTGYRLEYHLKKLNHLILTLNWQCLI